MNIFINQQLVSSQKQDTFGFRCGLTYRSPNTALGGQVARNAPWVVSIGFDDVNGKYHHECTGSVISNIAMLTAAHCLKSKYGI